jgi:hypothetical protein
MLTISCKQVGDATLATRLIPMLTLSPRRVA